MHTRCTNPKHPAYAHYGGRGIRIHASWSGPGGFEAFLAHVGPRPSLRHTIDRYPNGDGHYEPGNVRWATDTEQNNNRGDFNRRITVDGVTRTLSEWCRLTGVSRQAATKRIYELGWAPDRAVTAPMRAQRRP